MIIAHLIPIYSCVLRCLAFESSVADVDPIMIGLDNLKIFIHYLNNIHSTVKFTSSHSSTNIPFLDVNVSLTNDGNTPSGIRKGFELIAMGANLVEAILKPF